MHLSSDLKLEMTEGEAKQLWKFMSGKDDELNLTLSGLKKRLESHLWDRLSIEEMALAGSLGEVADV